MRSPSAFVLCRLVVALTAVTVAPASLSAQAPLPRPDQPGPWDQDIVVYRVPPAAAGGAPERLATFPRGGVATAARLADGRLAVAHQHFPENNRADFDKVAIRFSADEGRTWTPLVVLTVRGLPEGMRFPFDPTLVPLPDGRVRLYFTSRRLRDPADLPAIYSALSAPDDATVYTFEPGPRFAVPGRGVIDCAVAVHRGVVHLFAPDNGAGHPFDPGRETRPASDRARPGHGYHAVSDDGLVFARRPDVSVPGRRNWLGDVKSDGVALTFTGTGEGGLWRATSPDGAVWTLQPPLARVPVADPGTVTLNDGSLLVAGTGQPRPGTPSALRPKSGPRPPPDRPAPKN